MKIENICRFKRDSKLIILAILAIIFLIISPACATSIQKFGIDSKKYTTGDNISVSGEILDGNSSGQVRISIWLKGNEFTGLENHSSNITVYATSGLFSTTITAPANSGEYTIVVEDIESGIISPLLYFDVLGINDPKTIEVILTVGEVISISLSSSHGITGSLIQGKKGGSVTFEGESYYFLVSNDNVAYMDDDPEMNLSSDLSGNSVIGNLVEGSKIKLNKTTYTIIHIHNDTQIVLARPVTPVFSGGEIVNVTLIALNASNIPLSTNVTLDYVKNDGKSNKTTLSTNINGTFTTSINIPAESGVYHLIAGNVGHISLVVNTVDMFGDILSTEKIPKHTFSKNETYVAVVYIKNKVTGLPILNATVTANVTGLTNVSNSFEMVLTYDNSISAYTANYTIPANTILGMYNVKYAAIVGSQTQKAYSNYNLKAYDIFMKAVSKENDESDGFAPGKEAFIILAGTDLSNGDSLDIEGMTGLDINKFQLNIMDSYGKNIETSWSVMNLSTFYSYLNVPTDVRDEIKRKLGENVTIINFTSPATNGIYDIVVQVNLTEWTNVKTSISVQDIFVRGEPVNKMGWFNSKIAPGAYARLLILAFNPSTGEQLTADKINDAGIVEVWSESASDVVTQYMLNSTLEPIDVPFVGTVKVLKFQVNDSYLGFHNVKFWVNASIDGTPKTVIGNGWFDEKSYTMYTKPEFDSGTGMFRAFGAEDNISLSVYVQDLSGNNVSSATIEVQSVKYGMNGENVPFTVDSSSSSKTNNEGEATVEFNPAGSLKSGFYNVRIKMTTQDGVTDYGNGWFEVRNFIFFSYSTSWDAGVNKPINFTLNAFDADFNNKNVNVTLTKIISRGDWEKMAQQYVYNETLITVGSINGTGYYEYPGLNKGGNYEFRFEATDGISTEIGHAWIHATPFIAWVNTNGKYEFSTTEFMNFTVEASADKMIGGTLHNITNVTIDKVMQEGMQMTTYRNKSQMELITTSQNGINVNQINVSINTSGWGQGGYSMVLKISDNQSNEVYTNFWFQLKLASVSVPEPLRVVISGGQYYTNTTSINATTDITSKKDKFAGNSLGNISAGKVSGPVINDQPITMIVGAENMWNHSEIPYFTMVAVDTVQNTVYIEYENQSLQGIQYFNLSDNTTTQVFNASVGEMFTDYTGRTWKILEITSDGTVKLQGINTLKNGLIINQSVMSKSLSGKFLLGDMQDEEWRKVDLDGDGNYYGQERYHILLIDSNISGKYDTVYVSNIYNFSSGTYIDASAGNGIQFGGNPIYMLSNKYQSGAYTIEFTTYQKGWGGMNIGSYANGSVLKIPFLVTTPDGTPVSGSKVSIDFLMDESRLKYPLSGINNTTDAKGLALISINTTLNPIQTGAWMIYYNASIGSQFAVADEDMFWEMPRFELRNYMISGALGTPGKIDLIQLSDSNPFNGLPGNNMLLSYGDEIEFKRGIGFWFNDATKYQLEYPFDKWYYNTSTGEFNYSMDWGNTLLPGNGNLINSSSARNILTYNVTSKNNTGDIIVLNPGQNKFYDNMWIFNVTQGSPGNTTIAMSYKGWPWTLPSNNPGNPGPMLQTFRNGSSWWIGGLDFTVETIYDINGTVILRLNKPILVAHIDSMSHLMDSNLSNGELDKMRGSVNKVTFNSMDYLVYGYEDKAPTSGDLVNSGHFETMDRVCVVNITSGATSIYSIGQPIPVLNEYYTASVPEWGGKLVLLNNSTTQVFPSPQWGADEPIYYAGKFSDTDLGVDLATLGGGGGPDMPKGNITSDKRYSMLMFDTIPNGANFPTQAIYDDDHDLTQLMDWSGPSGTSYDMYDLESGYGDALPNGMIDPMNIQYVNMSERFAQDIGIGNMESYPMAIPTIKVNSTAKTATAKTFALKKELDKNDSINIYLTAKDYEGTPIIGIAVLKQLKMSFGGSFTTGMFDDLPKTWDMTSAMVNVTLVEGEGLLKVTSSNLPAELKSGGSHDFGFGEFTLVVEVNDDSGKTETLKSNFFMLDRKNMKDMSGGGKGGPGESGE